MTSEGNYPMGAQYDRAAPYNEPTRRTLWQEYYITADIGIDQIRQFEVYFPKWLSDYEVTELAQGFCKGHGFYYVDWGNRPDRHLITCLTEVYYE